MIQVTQTIQDGVIKTEYLDSGSSEIVSIIQGPEGSVSISTTFAVMCPCCYQPQCYASCDGSQMGEEDAEAAGVAFESEDDIDERRSFNQTIDGIEALLMAMAGEGVDMNNEAIARAAFAAAEGAANNA